MTHELDTVWQAIFTWTSWVIALGMIVLAVQMGGRQRTVISLVLGVPAEDRAALQHWFDLVIHREPGNPNPTPEGVEAYMKAHEYFHDLALEKRQHPGDDMMSRLCQVSVERDTGGTTQLTDAEISAFGVLRCGAGSETVTKLIGNGIVLFHENPDQWQKVLDDPGRIADAVEEILRWSPPAEYVGRFTRRDVTVEGETIPAESPVLLLIRAACNDERGLPGRAPLRDRSRPAGQHRVRVRHPQLHWSGSRSTREPRHLAGDPHTMATLPGGLGRLQTHQRGKRRRLLQRAGPRRRLTAARQVVAMRRASTAMASTSGTRVLVESPGVVDSGVGGDGQDEVDDDTSGRDDAERREPESRDDADRAGELEGGENRNVAKGNADDSVDDSDALLVLSELQ